MRLGQTVAMMWSCAVGCTSANGGAVDLSWRLKPAAGFSEPSALGDSFVDCDNQGTLTDSMGNSIQGVGKLTAIRLYWQVADQLGPADASLVRYEDFECSTENGVTNFEIPPGSALLYVAPLCAGSGSAGSNVEANSCAYTAPAPVERTMVAGQTVELGALEIVLDVGTGSAGLNSCMSIGSALPKEKTCICMPTTQTGCSP
jgi:hypothetical protein